MGSASGAEGLNPRLAELGEQVSELPTLGLRQRTQDPLLGAMNAVHCAGQEGLALTRQFGRPGPSGGHLGRTGDESNNSG